MWGKIVFGLVFSVVLWYFIRELLISLDNYIRKIGLEKKQVKEKKSSGFKFSTDPVFHR